MQVTPKMREWRKNGVTYKEIAKRLGVAKSTVMRAFNGRSDRPASKRPNRKRSSVQAVSESELLMETDLETRASSCLREELAGLGELEYMRDYDLRKACGCASDSTTWRNVSQSREFAGHAMEIGSRSNPAMYWGRQNDVASMVNRRKARRPAWAELEQE